jgi:hypothetical protein
MVFATARVAPETAGSLTACRGSFFQRMESTTMTEFKQYPAAASIGLANDARRV